jgi:hypothetical protein
MNKVSNKQKSIRIAPFKDKYLDYLNKCESYEINCLEGAIRSGKTIVNLIAFSHYIDNHSTGGIFVASSTTSGIAWEILAECKGHQSEDGKYGADQGFGLLYLFKGRCKRTKLKGSPAIEIINKKKKKCSILFVGAKNKGSIESVRGLTISGWIATELENHICVDGDDFLGFMFGRLMGASECKIFLDLNPSYPTNRMYTEYLDEFIKKDDVSFNYCKCNIEDNPAFTRKQIDKTLALYKDKNSIMYKRDILGERAAASGCIFSSFATIPNNWVLDDLSTLPSNSFITLGIDFGGNGSNTGFVATIISWDFKHVVPIVDDEIDMSNQDNATVGVYRERLRLFIEKVKALNTGYNILYCYCDSADTVMVNETRILLRKVSPTTRVYGCSKRTIKERIKLKSAMMSTKHWQVYKDCKYIINSTATQIWNSKVGHEDERLDDGTCDIDIADAEEYSWSAFYDKLNKFNIE